MLSKNDDAMDTIKDLQLAAERNLQAKSDELAEQMEEALKAAQKAERENSAEIAEFRGNLLTVETDLAERAAHQELLEHHKHVLGSQWDSKIDDLQVRLRFPLPGRRSDAARLLRRARSQPPVRAHADSLGIAVAPALPLELRFFLFFFAV